MNFISIIAAKSSRNNFLRNFISDVIFSAVSWLIIRRTRVICDSVCPKEANKNLLFTEQAI